MLSHEWDVFNTNYDSGIYKGKGVERFKNQGLWQFSHTTGQVNI